MDVNEHEVLHVVLPCGIDDVAEPSGGNAYDRRLLLGLATSGRHVREHLVPGSWPQPDAGARRALARVMCGLPDGSVVLVDGLIASDAPETLVPAAGRLRLVVLVHMPFGRTAGDAREGAVLSSAAAVVTTSAWSRRLVLERYDLDPHRVHVAAPGAERAGLAPGTTSGGELICVAAVTPGKGHDVLLRALAGVVDLPWRCTCVGSLTRDAAFADRLLRQARTLGIDDRVDFTGPLDGEVLARSWASADMLVLASRFESYGMVVTEALGHGLPVLATDVGGLPEALGRTYDGRRPGLLVPPGDAGRLTGALRRWLTDTDLRTDLRQSARDRRTTLAGWTATARSASLVLDEVAR